MPPTGNSTVEEVTGHSRILKGYSSSNDQVAQDILAEILTEGAHSWWVEDESN